MKRQLNCSVILVAHSVCCEHEEELIRNSEARNFGAQYTILLVEDETFVRQATAAALRSCGYIVLTAKDGGGALEICRDRSKPIDLLLSDIVMPGMSGGDLAKAFQAMHPQARVLLMSGYAEELAPYMSLTHSTHHLRKPFSVGTLIEAVREALNAEVLSSRSRAMRI